MLFALDEINKNPNILPNTTLGAKIYDTCRSQTIGVDRAKDFIKYTLLPTTDKTPPPLAGVIGAFRSDVSIAVANLLRVFDIPQVKLFNLRIIICTLLVVCTDVYQQRNFPIFPLSNCFVSRPVRQQIQNTKIIIL